MRVILALAVGAMVLAGCSGQETPGTPKPAPGTGGQPSASADPPAESDSVPKVAAPLDASAFEADPCGLTPLGKIGPLGFSEAGKPKVGDELTELVGPACSWNTEKIGRYVQLQLGTGNRAAGAGGLVAMSHAYETGRLRFFEQAPDVDGYPAFFTGLRDERDQGKCDLAVGIADDLAILINASGYENSTDSCETARGFASAAVETLKLGA